MDTKNLLNLRDQLGIVTKITEAQLAGEPIQWEVNDVELHPDKFIKQSVFGDPVSFLHPVGRYVIRLCNQPWQAERDAWESGKTVQFRNLNGMTDGRWHDLVAAELDPWERPGCDNFEYRIKPEPTPISAVDVPPGSVFRHPSWINDVSWAMPVQVTDRGVSFCQKSGFSAYTYKELMADGWKFKTPGDSGWKKCEKIQ